MDKHGKELATGWCFGGNGFRQDPGRDRSIHLFVTVLYSSSTARGHRLLGWGGVLEGNYSVLRLKPNDHEINAATVFLKRPATCLSKRRIKLGTPAPFFLQVGMPLLSVI
jgi:hypothetical protein